MALHFFVLSWTFPIEIRETYTFVLPGASPFGLTVHAPDVGSDSCGTYAVTALTSFYTPHILDGSVSSIGLTSTFARITWQTDYPSDSTVNYGTDQNNEFMQATNAVYSTGHSIPMTGLSPNTLYYYTVKSCNPVNCDQKGGFSFTTCKCDPGWFCVDGNTQAYRNCDCTVSNSQNCYLGCQNGGCISNGGKHLASVAQPINGGGPNAVEQPGGSSELVIGTIVGLIIGTAASYLLLSASKRSES